MMDIECRNCAWTRGLVDLKDNLSDLPCTQGGTLLCPICGSCELFFKADEEQHPDVVAAGPTERHPIGKSPWLLALKAKWPKDPFLQGDGYPVMRIRNCDGVYTHVCEITSISNFHFVWVVEYQSFGTVEIEHGPVSTEEES